MIDLYTHNVDYIGTRKDGNGSGNYLLVGPDWKGEQPKNIRRVIPVETEFVTLIWRTQLFNPADLENVLRVQADYSLVSLHEFTARTAPAPVPTVAFPRISRATVRPQFFEYLNFVFRFCPTHPTEKELRKRFARIGVGPGGKFPPKEMSDELREAIESGVQDGERTIDEAVEKARGSGELFGSRGDLKNNYLNRTVGARIGLFGNTAAGVIAVDYQVDADGLPRDTDGGFTIHVQKDLPGEERETNWLPASGGPMLAVLRLYLPKPAVFSGAWTGPVLKKMSPNDR